MPSGRYTEKLLQDVFDTLEANPDLLLKTVMDRHWPQYNPASMGNLLRARYRRKYADLKLGSRQNREQIPTDLPPQVDTNIATLNYKVMTA